MWFFRRRSGSPQKRPPISAQLAALIRVHMDSADDDDVRIATAIAGLFATIAYADREYAAEERTRIRDDLTRMQTLPSAGVNAVCALLDEHIVELSASNTQSYTRDLCELLDVESRREVLTVLVDLAAADGTISHSESNLLRRVTNALALTPDDYLAAQAAHRDRLPTLK